MSLVQSLQGRRDLSFPRVSGDEPGLGRASIALGLFSPRERG